MPHTNITGKPQLVYTKYSDEPVLVQPGETIAEGAVRTVEASSLSMSEDDSDNGNGEGDDDADT